MIDIDDEDDFYAPDDAVPETKAEAEEKPTIEAKKETAEDKDLEEGEEEEGEEIDRGEDEEEEEDEEESDDSDIEVITERKEGSKPLPPTTQPRYNTISIAPNKSSTPTPAKSTAAQTKKETASLRTVTAPSGGGDLPAIATSKLDINAKPVYPPAGKPITAVEIDADLPENDKPWRRPGADVSDFFNYGFDEFTWALYATKQENLRSEFSADKVAQNSKKMMEEMSSMMMMGGMAPMAGMPSMPAPDGSGMTPEMMAVMQQMMGAGMDPGQMSEQMFAAMQTGGGAGQGAYGQGYGFDPNTMNGGSSGGGGGRGNFGGGGRGRRGGRGGW